MFNFANSAVRYKNWYCFISIKFDVKKSEVRYSVLVARGNGCL